MFKSLNIFCKINNSILFRNSELSLQVRNFAARKGTREKARKKKVKVEIKKVGFIPHNLRNKDKLDLLRAKKRVDDSWKRVAIDNVWVAKYYQWQLYSFTDAVQCHRETHHPTIYNRPDAPLKAIIELDMTAEKKNRYMDNFHRIAGIPHPFEHGEERTVLAFAKDRESQDLATKSGATLVGGSELIKDIQNGDLLLQDFQYVVAHPNILPELVSVRGLMKKKFPNPKSETLGMDLAVLVKKYLTGIKYSAIKDEHEQDFGIIETIIGNLDMETKYLEENFKALIEDINSVKPKRAGPFITRCVLVSEPSSEKFKVDYEKYIISTSNKKNEVNKEDIEEEKIEAVN